MSENKNTVPVNGTEGREMRKCVENKENIAGRLGTIGCTKATTMTTTVILTQTTMNNVFDTHKQGSGGMSDRNTTKPTSNRPVTTHATAATTSTPCGGNSGQHSSYLKDNLNIVRQKCSEFHACTVELYKSENLHRILAGDNIQLRNICGLLYQNANGGYRILDNQCTAQERESIKELLGNELSPFLEGSIPREDSWEKLKSCLNITQGDSTYIDKLCSNVLASEAADWLILLLIVIIIVLCVRQRKLKRRLTTESKRSGKTTSPTDEPCCSTQGIRDHSQVFQTPNSRPAGQQPRSPERSIPYQLPTTTSNSDYDYLELLPDVTCMYHKQQLPEHCHSATVGTQRSPLDRPYALAKHVAPSPASERKTRASEGPDRSLEEGTYFEKIDMKSVMESNSEGVYTPLGLTPTLMVRRQSADSEEDESGNPQYFELESS